MRCRAPSRCPDPGKEAAGGYLHKGHRMMRDEVQRQEFKGAPKHIQFTDP
jgi:hypothetical protein